MTPGYRVCPTRAARIVPGQTVQVRVTPSGELVPATPAYRHVQGEPVGAMVEVVVGGRWPTICTDLGELHANTAINILVVEPTGRCGR